MDHRAKTPAPAAGGATRAASPGPRPLLPPRDPAAAPVTAHDHRDPSAYRFDQYVAASGQDWLQEDGLLKAWLAKRPADAVSMRLVESFGRRAATSYRDLAHVVELRGNHPQLSELDPFNRETHDVVLPAETWQMLGEVHGSGIWKASMDERARYASVYLLSQNGEFGVICSMACTDGMLRALRLLGDDGQSKEVIAKLEGSTEASWIHGAQFVTEIQGGSDAATNEVQAAKADDGGYRLSGQKWFCSNLTADYWMLTARIPGGPDNHRGIGLFCVPRRWDGAANGWQLQRLKDKLGTRALPTAEIQFDGARGWPVGPLDAGLKNMVAVVLTTSRVYNTLASAAAHRRAVREARAYADFRRAFGKPLGEHPLLAASLERLERRADEVEAGALSVVDTWLDGLARPDDKTHRLWARILISIAKAVTAREAVGDVYEAMMVLGGNGIDEQFCALPRLWRDAAIMETWEGPYTLLLMQALGDLAKYEIPGKEEAFLRYGLGDALQAEHATALADILRTPDAKDSIVAWGELAPKIYRCYQQHALAELRSPAR